MDSKKIRVSDEGFKINRFMIHEEKIDDLLREIVENNAGGYSKETFKKSAVHILVEIGKALFEATSDNGRGMREIYFWPGYDSFFDRQKQTRIMIEKDGKGCGIGFRPHDKERDKEYKQYYFTDSLTCFGHVLGMGVTFLSGGKEYSPGGTHGWISQLDNPVLKSPDKGEIDLSILEIKLNDDTYSASTDFATGKATIKLNEHDSENWGSRIGAILNNKESSAWNKIHSRGIKIEAGHPWPIANQQTKNDAVQKVREKLYSVWLSSCFNRNWKTLPWLQPFLSEIGIDYRNLMEKAGERAKEKEFSPSYYKYWYTIGLTKTLLIDTKDNNDGVKDLGSLMFLSSYPLDTDVLYLVKNWIESIYLRLRSLEDQYYLKAITEKREKSETTSKWAHALKTRFLLTKTIILALKGSGLPEERKNKYLKIMDSIYDAISQSLTGIQETLKVDREMINEKFLEFKAEPGSYSITDIQNVLVDSLRTAFNRVLIEPDHQICLAARRKLFKIKWQNLIAPGFKINDEEKFEEILFANEYSLMQLDKFQKIERYCNNYLNDKVLEINIGSANNEYLLDFQLRIPDKNKNSPIQLPIKFIISSLLDECVLNAFKHSYQSDPQIKINLSLYSKFKDGDLNYIKVEVKNRIQTEKNTDGAANQPLIKRKVDRNLIRHQSKTRNGLDFIEFMANLLFDYNETGLNVWDVEVDKTKGINYFVFNIIVPVYLYEE